MSLVEQYNIGARIKSRTAMVGVGVAQSSATLATTQDGVTVDRLESGLRRYYSCKVVAFGSLASNTSLATGSVTLNFQHSSDGTSWDNYSTATVPTAVVWGSSTVGNTQGTTAGTVYGVVEQSVNLNGARRYIRMQLPTPTYLGGCSSGTILTMAAAIIFGGADELPAQ